MKKKLLLTLGLSIGLGISVLGAVPKPASASSAPIQMYRLYNKNSGEHFYTKDTHERDHLKKVGWRYEGVGWKAPKSGQPVYRLYNKNAGDHHYTLNKNEKDHLVKVGWRYEGIGWYSDSEKKVPLYRSYNPNAKAGSHNYTVNYNEQKNLLKHGWRNEGIAWYGTTESSTPTPPKVDKTKLNSLVSSLSSKTNDHYTSSSWSAFQTALKDAKTVLANNKATQQNVDSAYSKLSTANTNLKTQYYTVTINYFNQDKVLLDHQTVTVKEGTKYTAKAKTFDGYDLDGANSQTVTVNSNKVISFNYKKKTENKKVTIRYVDQQGYGIAEPTIEYVKKGTSYTAKAKTFDGFRVDGDSSKSQTISDDTTITFKYILTYKVNIKYVDVNGKELAPADQKIVDDGTQLTVNAKNLNGYVVDGDTSQTVDVNYDGYTITFRYLKKLTMTVRYIVAGTNQLLDQSTQEAIESKPFTATQQTFDGYALFGDTTQTIQNPSQNQTLTFSYKPIDEIVTKIRNDAMNIMNDYRASQGVVRLDAIDTLNKGADIRALEIQDKYNHERPNGTLGITVAEEVGYPNYIKTENIWRTVGEGAKQAYENGGNDLITSWKNSPSHNAGMLYSVLNEGGIGVNVRVNADGTVNIGYAFLGGYHK